MKQYYIPTSSLNFNNIFSTESISPAAFYEQRGFGYSRWASIDENRADNYVTLYGSRCSFTRPQSDLEDHPMLIEIRTEEEFPQIVDGVYYSDHTIYLNPWNTRVWFFSEVDKRRALSMSESSLETKMLRLYERNIKVGTFNEVYASCEVLDNIALNVEALDADRRINRLKGLLYGYYIGACKSMTKQEAEVLHALYVIQDTFSAIVLSPDKQATISQENVLNTAFDVLRSTSSFYTELQAATQTADILSNVMHLLERYAVNTPLSEYDVNFHLRNLRYEQGSNGGTMRWVGGKIEELSRKMDASQHLLSPDESEVVVCDRRISIIKGMEDPVLTKVLMLWIDGVLMDPKYNGKISAQQMDLATDLLRSAKEFLSTEWESSSIRTFLNQLRHLINGEEVNLPWCNDILSSVAAVVYKGADWEKLIRFMQFQNMSDYRISLAVYGELNGFANLTRDFTDIILNQESSYVADFYKEFYGQLFASDICKEPMPQIVSVLVSVETAETKTTSSLAQIVLNYFYSAEFDYRSKEKLLPELKVAIELNGDNEDIQKFLPILYQRKGWEKKNKPGKLISEKFEVKKEKNFIQKVIGSLFPSEEEQQNTSTTEEVIPFINDSNAYRVIESILPNSRKIREQVREDLLWFQENYKEYYNDSRKGRQPGKYYGRPIDNVSVLSHFHEYCCNKLSPTSKKMDWLADIWKQVDIDAMITLLSTCYK